MNQPQLPIPDPLVSRERSRLYLQNLLAILRGERHAANDPQPSEHQIVRDSGQAIPVHPRS